MNMVTNNSPHTKIVTVQDVFFMVFIGLGLGLLGGLVQKVVASIILAIVLVSFWGAYNQVVANKVLIKSGLLIGGGLGTAVGVIAWLLDGGIQGIGDSALFGLLRGVLVGAAVGLVTRAPNEENDTPQTKFLIVAGSILLGLVLGGLVGLTAGFFLGLIGEGLRGAIRAAVAGSILGATIGSYFKEVRWVAVAAATLAVLAALSALLDGAVAGVVLGAISGSFAPILLVSTIGAFGGLSSRGLKAMLVEALEAPTEMMEQGAVAFLAPALIIGMIVGAASSGAAGILALTITLAFLGLFFGILGDIAGNISKMTVRAMVEMAMLGAEAWPVGKVIQQITHKSRQATIGAAIGAGIALVGGVAGVGMSHLILTLLATR